MSAISDLPSPPLSADEPTVLPAAPDRTMPNRGAPPASLMQLSLRHTAFQPADRPGELGRLGRYRILKELGKGGMGAVYLGFDERLQRKVALKVMRPDAAADDEAKERFLREARAAAQISHDNVIAIHEADEIHGVPFIAMQYLQGYPLDQYLAKKGRPSFPQVIRIGREVALGLAAAHKFGIVHRDIKPGNVWLEAPNGRVKILDFGLARPTKGHKDGELTAEGAVVGTPAYMAPEQARGEKLDHRADLFSLGVVLYRLVTNRLPFDGPDVMAVLTALAVDDPKPVWELTPAVPRPLADLIHKLMAKKPAQRPQTADEVSARLHAMADRSATATAAKNQVVYVPISVTMLGAADNAFAELGEGDTESASHKSMSRIRPPHEPPGRTWPVGLMLAGALAMVLGGGIIVKIVNKDGTTTEVKVPEGAKVVVEKDGKKVLDTGAKPAEAKKDAIEVSPFPKLDATWLKAVTALPPTDLFGPVNEELRRRNPTYDGKGLSWVADPIIGTRTALEVRSDALSDLTPLVAFANLEGLILIGAGKNASPVWNLAPLRGLKKLRSLHLANHPDLKDLGPLKGLPLERFFARGCGIESLAPLAGMKLEKLEIPYTPVRDLAPVAGMPLQEVWVGTPETPLDLAALGTCPLERLHIEYGLGVDLAPLKKCPLKTLSLVYVSQPDLSPLEGSGIEKFSGFDYFQFEPFLRTLPKLETVAAYNAAAIPKEEYFTRFAAWQKGHDDFVAATGKLPLAERMAAVKKRSAELNAGRKSELTFEVVDGEVVAVSFAGSDHLSQAWNFSFLRCFPTLKRVDLRGYSYFPLFHTIQDLPIEEIQVSYLGGAVGYNLYVLPRMKALKSINGTSIADVGKAWNFKPAAK